MSARARNILIALILLLLIGGGVIWFFLSRKTPAPAPEAPAAVPAQPSLPLASDTGTAKPTVNPLALDLSAPPAPEVKPRATTPLPTAELFAERYGSYSNQEAPYQNLRDLLPIMTDAYRAETQAKIDAAAQTPPAASYDGTTSVKFSSSLIQQNEAAGTAQVRVILQQTHTVGSAAPQVSYRNLIVSLVKQGDQWKVGGASWEQ